jgi:hypothetical protein
MNIVTLGPQGTCSCEVVSSYIADLGLSLEDMELCKSYEEAVNLVLIGAADQVVVPAAYMNFHEIVFRNTNQLRIHEILYSQTPVFVLAAKRGLVPAQSDTRVYTLACHPSPAPLMDRLKFQADRVDAASNAYAAWMVSDGHAELCITQLKAIETLNREVPPERQLEVIETYDAVDMVWAVFKRGAPTLKRHFWRGHFEEITTLES